MTKTEARIIQYLATQEDGNERDLLFLLVGNDDRERVRAKAALRDLINEGIVKMDRHWNLELAPDCVIA